MESKKTEKVIPEYVSFGFCNFPVCPNCRLMMKDVPEKCPACGVGFERFVQS